MRKQILVAAAGAAASYLRSSKGRATLSQLSGNLKRGKPAAGKS
jgi:hypothetical protein